MPSKRVRVHYRRLYRTSEPAISAPLAPAVARALQFRPEGGAIALTADVRLRSHHDGDYGTVIPNGPFTPPSGHVFGELVRYDPDANILLLVQNSSTVD